MIDRRRFSAAMLAGAAALAARPARAEEPQIELKPDLAQLFLATGTEGGFAALRLKQRKLIATDENRTRMRVLPASTFKVPHALIALETGVVADTDKELIRWDGVTRDVADWNRDHTLRSALQFSAVPVFQEIARRIGEQRMHKYVEAFDYGNRDIGGGLDHFWLDGNLRISPLEQIAFLQRLYNDELPASSRSLMLTKDIMPRPAEDERIRAKTGTVNKDGKPWLGWLVGWTETADPTLFALNLDVHSEADLARRPALAQQMLAKVGAL